MDWYYKEVFFGMNAITTLCWIVIPFVIVVLMFCLKRKLLWTSPIIAAIIVILLNVVGSSSIITYSEHRSMFFGLFMPIHLAISIGMTVIAYTINYANKKRKNIENKGMESN